MSWVRSPRGSPEIPKDPPWFWGENLLVLRVGVDTQAGRAEEGRRVLALQERIARISKSQLFLLSVLLSLVCGNSNQARFCREPLVIFGQDRMQCSGR